MRLRSLFAIFLAGAALAARAPLASADPVAIRVDWVAVPAELTPILFAHPGVAKHEGVSYTLQPVHCAGSPIAFTAFASGDIDIGGFGYSTIANAIVNAAMQDLRVIGDVAQDSVPGWSSNSFFVLRDSPIYSVEDLKGKVLAVQAIGSLTDITQRTMLRRHGLDDKRDVSVIEIALSNMKAALIAKRADMIPLMPPFLMDPEIGQMARVLFTQREAIGTVQISTLVARTGFIAAHRAALVDFLEDNARAIRWYLDPANHEEAVRILAEFFKAPPRRFDWAFTHRDQYRDPNLMPNITAMQANIALLHSAGLLKTGLDIRPYIDLGLAQEAVARIGKE